MRCNVVGRVAEGDVDCFVVGRHGGVGVFWRWWDE